MKRKPIEDMIKNPMNLKLSKSYHKYDNVEEMDIDKKDDIYHIKATVDVLGKKGHCEFDMDEEGNLLLYQCDCSWCDEKSPCGHIGAVLLKMNELNIDVFPFHYISDKHIRMQEEFERMQKEAYMKKMKEQTRESHMLIHQLKSRYQSHVDLILQDEKYEIEPVLHLEYDGLYISYKVGLSKKYVIKNIQQFLQNIDHQEKVTYGKNLSFTHTYSSFDEFSQKQIDFLRKAYEISMRNISPYYRPYDADKRIFLSGEPLDMFFETYQESDCDQVYFDESDEKLNIQLIKDKGLYVLNVEMKKDIIFGEINLYYIEEDVEHIFITRIPSDDQGVLNELVSSIPKEGLSILEEDYPDFYKYVLSPILDYIEISTPIDMIENTFQTIHLYGDINDHEEVEVWVEYIDDDGNRQRGFHLDFITNYQQDIVEKYIEKYADHINYEKHIAYFDMNSQKTFEFVQDGLSFLKEYCEIYVSESLKNIGIKKNYNLNVGVKFESDLLSLNIESTQIPQKELAHVLEQYRRKKKFYRLKNGELLYLNSPQLEELSDFLNEYQIDTKDMADGVVSMESYRMFSLKEDTNHFESIKCNRHQSFQEKLNSFQEKQISHDAISSHYQSILRDYQKDGVKWMMLLRQYGFNGILADDMGLGKTLQVIALLESLKDRKTSLVVCPSSLVYNWEEEVHKFSDTLKVCAVTRGIQERKEMISRMNEYDLLVTSYDTLRRDIEYYQDKDFEYVILDEAQYIKNQKTKNAKSVKKLKASHKLALTGTPIENSLAELWSIFDFLMPQYLYNYPYFHKVYENDIVKNQDREKTKKLKTLVSPFILRRNKKDVLKELPDKIEKTLLIPFKEKENELYLANLAQVNEVLQTVLKMDNVNKVEILAMLTRLRQLCCEPRMVYENIENTSSKLEECIRLVTELHESNQKILLFSSFTTLLDLIAQELSYHSISYYMLTGKTSKEERRDLVHQFQNDETAVFLISLKAGGTGLNLTAAQAVIHYDPWWNVSAQNQATDRAYRIGQENKVQVFKLVMKDSIEEKIMKLQQQKKELADAFIENNEGSLAKMSQEDIMQLFTMDI